MTIADSRAIAAEYDTSTLESFYESYQKNPTSSYYQNNIEAELLSIRKQIESELQSIVSSSDQSIEQIESSEYPKAVERQANIVNLLQERLRTNQVDLDLLQSEERTFYSSGGTIRELPQDELDLMTTNSYVELQAEQKVLEIRIDVLKSILKRQEERSEKLKIEQREQQFTSFLSYAKYIWVIAIVWLIETLIRTKILAKIKNRDKRYTTTKSFTAIMYSSLTIWLVGILMSNNPGLLASLAIVGAGIAIALQDIIKDFFGWAIIIKQRMYMLGDRITVGDVTGDVIDVGLLRTTILEIGMKGQTGIDALERTGKVLTFPNALVLSSKMTNHSATSDFVRSEIVIIITFESNWEKAEEILKAAVDDVALIHADNEERQLRKRERKFFLPHRIKGNQVHMEIADDGVLFTLRFTVPIGERRLVVTALTRRILKDFAKEKDIQLAYKTIRYFTQ